MVCGRKEAKEAKEIGEGRKRGKESKEEGSGNEDRKEAKGRYLYICIYI